MSSSLPRLSFFQRLDRLAKILFGLTLLSTIGILAIGLYFYLYFSRDLPKLTSITEYKPPLVSEVYAEDGQMIGVFWDECRTLLPYKEIPELVINAFVASEDSRFWDHRGVDIRSIVRAFYENLKAGHVVQGGSTITQQVARSLLLTREKKLGRKIKEAILATQIEQHLSKEQILFLYLNQIYLGNRAYGIEAAARNYFHKNARELTLAEISIIAGLPSAPSSFNPIISPKQAKERQQHVLNQMVDNGYVKKKEAEAALKEPLKIYRAGIDKEFNNQYAPYFTENVRRALMEKYGSDLIYQGGLKIYTTADLKANKAAEKALKDGLRSVDRRQGFRGPIETVAPAQIGETADQIHADIVSQEVPYVMISGDGGFVETEEMRHPTLKTDKPYKAVVTDTDPKFLKTLIGHKKGIILNEDKQWAWRPLKKGDLLWVQKKNANPDDSYFVLSQEPKVEGAIFSYEPVTGKIRAIIGGYDFARSEFNRATQAYRQPGSAFKPIIYSAALDKGYSPRTPVVDGPVTFQVSSTEFYSPKNYGNKHNGLMTVRTALAHSVNIIAVKIFYDIGVDYTIAYARKLGITTPIHRYLSSALGASDITLQDLTTAYGTFANHGIRPKLFMITKVVDQNGKVLEQYQPPKQPEAIVMAQEGSEGDSPKGKKRKKEANTEELNTPLFEAGKKVIERENLKISNEEMKILYGTSIPEGFAISPQTAHLMVSLLSEVVNSGTGFKAKELKRPAAGKTGTTNDETDCWFVAFTPDLLTGVWIGYDNKKKLGEKMTGGVIAAPVWLSYMQEVLKDKPVASFEPPKGFEVAKIDTLMGGSAPLSKKQEVAESTPEAAAAEKETSSSRGIEFLFGY